MYDLKHLDTIDLDLLKFGVVGRVTSLGDRDLSPFLVGGNWNPQILKRLELFVGTLRLEAALSLYKRGF